MKTTQYRPRKLSLAFLMLGAFAVSYGAFSLALGGSCETTEERVAVPVTLAEDFSGRIVGYKESDMLGWGCGGDVIIKRQGDVVEFDCWRNGSFSANDKCSCEITVVSWPKANVTRCG